MYIKMQTYIFPEKHHVQKQSVVHAMGPWSIGGSAQGLWDFVCVGLFYLFFYDVTL